MKCSNTPDPQSKKEYKNITNANIGSRVEHRGLAGPPRNTNILQTTFLSGSQYFTNLAPAKFSHHLWLLKFAMFFCQHCPSGSAQWHKLQPMSTMSQDYPIRRYAFALPLANRHEIVAAIVEDSE